MVVGNRVAFRFENDAATGGKADGPLAFAVVLANDLDVNQGRVDCALGGLDGDQVSDVEVANYWHNNVSVLLGNGDGTFADAVQYTAGGWPYCVAIGDLNGDEVPDLAVANSTTDNVSVLLGLGDGTFAAAVNYLAGDRPNSVAIGDLDGDEVPDLAVANYVSDNVSVLLGQRRSVECLCGDLDGDGGRTDLSDFSKFQVCFGLRTPTEQCPEMLFNCADLDGSGWINLTDFSTFQVLFGTVSSSSPPNCTD